MIVVRANDDVFVGLPGKVRQDILHGGARALDVDVEGNAQIAGECEGIRRCSRVQMILNCGERLPGGREPGLRDIVLGLDHDDAGILRTVHASKSGEQILFAIAQLSVDQDDRPGAVISRVDRLGDQLGMFGESGVPALRRKSRRFVAKQEDDLVLYVEVRVVVVIEFGRGRAVSGKYNGAAGFGRGREAEGNEILIQFQILFGCAILHFQAIAILQLRSCNYRERLKVGICFRQAEAPESDNAPRSNAWPA